LDSIKLRKEIRRITPSDAKEAICSEFLERASWLPRQFNKVFRSRSHNQENGYHQNINYQNAPVQPKIV
jgi:hypothetical protein